jgi:hypothetical protein
MRGRPEAVAPDGAADASVDGAAEVSADGAERRGRGAGAALNAMLQARR